MVCHYCGCEAPGDAGTGYDADEVCGDCARRECEACHARLRAEADTTGLCPACLDERHECRRAEAVDRVLDQVGPRYWAGSVEWYDADRQQWRR